MKVIEFKDVFKSFSKDPVLKGLSFSLMQGEFCMLIGHNGAGKSTILNLIARNEFTCSGEIECLGREVHADGYFHNQEVGFVHERVNYKLPFSVKKFVEIYSKEFSNWDQEFFDKMVKDRRIDLSKRFTNYSRGQKMQISLMITMARKPKILLVDEITSVLDISGQKYFLSLLKDFARSGHTVILTTNIISEAQNHCDRILFIDNGVVCYNELKEDFLEPFIKLELKNAKEVFKNIKSPYTLVESTRDYDYVLIDKRDNEFDFKDYKELPPSIEDIFLHQYKYKEDDADAA